MDESFAKVFRSMYTGSMYGAGLHVFAVWGWVLAHADENGLVEINPDLVADELGKGGATVAQQVRNAIDYLMQPDPKSRSPVEEGRRIVHIEAFTYHVVNRVRYTDKGGSRSAYWVEYRAKKKAKELAAQQAQQLRMLRATESTQVEVEVEVEKKEPPIVPQRKTSRGGVAEKPEEVPDNVWNEFLLLRKQKKSTFSGIALAGIQREANKAGMTITEALTMSIERGWQGFRAEWVANRTSGAPPRQSSDPEIEWDEDGNPHPKFHPPTQDQLDYLEECFARERREAEENAKAGS